MFMNSLAFGDDDLRLLRAQAIRAAMDRVAPSVVRVEKFGVIEGGGEVAEDAPTVAIAIDEKNHFIASSLVRKQFSSSLVLVAADGTRSTAKVIASDLHRDYVLLEASEPLGVPAVTIGDPQTQVGQTVIAVGRIAGDGSIAVSSGVLSAKDRLWGIALQTDARVSSVFYGGPMIDLQGQLLGVMVAAVPDDMGEESTAWYDAGVAFAIPIQAIAERLDTLLAGQDIQGGVIGIVADSNDPYVESAKISAVKPRSPAARADIRAGDIVVTIDENPIRSHREIKQILGAMDAGEKVEMKLSRGDESLTKTVTLIDSIPPLEPQWLGIMVSQATGKKDKPASVIVTGIFEDSAAKDALKIGDEIQSINGSPVESVLSLRRRIFSADPDEAVVVKVLRRSESDESEVVDLTIKTSNLADRKFDPLPTSLPTTKVEGEKWAVTELSLPDIANKGFLVAPESTAKTAASNSDKGLLLLLADPGEADLQKAANGWLSVAEKQQVIVCLLQPADEARWQPDEVDAAVRVAASIGKRHEIDDQMTVVGGLGKGAGGSMAMAVAIARPGKFSGLAIRSDVTPPAIRLRENDASAPLEMLLREVPSADDPTWVPVLKKAGYAILRGDDKDATVLNWIRSMRSL